MKTRIISMFLLTLLSAVLLTGCSVLSNPKTQGTKPAPQADLYSKVPESMRAAANEASRDLSQSRSNLKLAEKQLVLADLIKQHAVLKEKFAKHNLKLAEKLVEKTEVSMQRKRLEAIDNANLGDKADNIKKIASLRTKELSIESSLVRIRADMDALDLDIRKLDDKITRQSQNVANHQ